MTVRSGIEHLLLPELHRQIGRYEPTKTIIAVHLLDVATSIQAPSMTLTPTA
ncbi:MAG: hypothetical protein OXK76_07540 [Gammaproteobacteria bacterium]|nr:hypothetical protein [Gammaproteobacteria bacterium]